jgi:hypothetical protein
MKSGLTFSLPASKPEADGILGLLKEVFTLVNEDKEEQAIDPEAFTGNLKDYPEWLRDACRDRDLVEALEVFCEFDPGELAEWCLEVWYEELSTCDAWNFVVRKRRDGNYELIYDVAEEHYGGDIAPGWILLAAGASKVVGQPLRREDS